MQGIVHSAFADSGVSEDDVQYVTDAGLNLVFVNQAWRRFFEANRPPQMTHGWRTALLDGFKGSERARWLVIYQSLLDGRTLQHTEPFLCPSPRERRAFVLHIKRYIDPETGLLYLVHKSVRVPHAGGEQGFSFGRQIGAQTLDSQVPAAGCLAPLEPVGGDLLWHRNLSAGGADLVIADAMGHGTLAARVASRMAHVLGTLPEEECVCQLVARLNGGLVDNQGGSETEELPRARFATGLFLRVDPAHREVTLCSFGHAGPLFSRAGQVDVAPGLPVGITPGKSALVWKQQTLRFDDHGARLLAFTDGVTEQFNAAGDMFGTGRLAHAFRQSLHQPLPQMLNTIQDELDAFAGAALVKDDRALLAIECRR